MIERISTMEVRARIGDLLNRVALRNDEFVIERKGQVLAALVPVARLEQMRRAARQKLGDFLALRQGSRAVPASDDEAMDVVLKAQREARRALRRRKKPRRRRAAR